MKGFLILVIAMTGSFDVVAQKVIKVEKVTDHSTHIIADKFEGVIFRRVMSGSNSKMKLQDLRQRPMRYCRLKGN